LVVKARSRAYSPKNRYLHISLLCADYKDAASMFQIAAADPTIR
jgi:hypothetical protein